MAIRRAIKYKSLNVLAAEQGPFDKWLPLALMEVGYSEKTAQELTSKVLTNMSNQGRSLSQAENNGRAIDRNITWHLTPEGNQWEPVHRRLEQYDHLLPETRY